MHCQGHEASRSPRGRCHSLTICGRLKNTHLRFEHGHVGCEFRSLLKLQLNASYGGSSGHRYVVMWVPGLTPMKDPKLSNETQQTMAQTRVLILAALGCPLPRVVLASRTEAARELDCLVVKGTFRTDISTEICEDPG